jgi:hypothetical protein
MKTFYNTATGEIVAYYEGLEPESVSVFGGTITTAWIEGHYDVNEYYIEDNTPALRPSILSPSNPTANSWYFTELPAGTSIEVRDNELSSLLDTVPSFAGEISITLVDSGTYTFDIDVPFPYKKEKIVVEVE